MLNVGYGNYVNVDKIQAIVDFDSAPIRRTVNSAKKAGFAIDATMGSKTKSVIFLSDGNIVCSAVVNETLAKRFDANNKKMI